MGNPTNQQRKEQLEREIDNLTQQLTSQLHSEISQLEERMSLNQAVLKTKYGDLEKSITAMADGQVKMQETLTLFMASSSRV